MPRAAIVVHERDLDLGVRNVGSLGPLLSDRGFRVDVVSFEAEGAVRPTAGEADLVVLMGSADAAFDDMLPWLADEIAYVSDAVSRGIPVLGVCFGGQLLARVLGGTVTRAERSEHGFHEVETDAPSLVASGPWMQFHDDTFTLPPGATAVARTAAALQAFTSGPHLGVQFHPEITPDVFESWVDGWIRHGDRDAVESAVDVPAIRAAVAARSETAPAACAELLDAFLHRAGASPPSRTLRPS